MLQPELLLFGLSVEIVLDFPERPGNLILVVVLELVGDIIQVSLHT